MGSDQVAPPSLLSLIPLSVSSKRCLASLVLRARTCSQVSSTSLKLLAPADEQYTPLPSTLRKTQPTLRLTTRELMPRSFASALKDLASIGSHFGGSAAAAGAG